MTVSPILADTDTAARTADSLHASLQDGLTAIAVLLLGPEAAARLPELADDLADAKPGQAVLLPFQQASAQPVGTHETVADLSLMVLAQTSVSDVAVLIAEVAKI